MLCSLLPNYGCRLGKKEEQCYNKNGKILSTGVLNTYTITQNETRNCLQTCIVHQCIQIGKKALSQDAYKNIVPIIK